MEEGLLTIAITALLKRSRNAIQFTDSEIEAARADISNGARVLLTITAQFGAGGRTTYRADLVREGA